MNRGVTVRLPLLALVVAVALVADSPLADWLRAHWDVALAGLIVIIGATWVSTGTGLTTPGTMDVGGAATIGGTLGVTGAATLASSSNVAAAMQFTNLGAAAAGKIGSASNTLALCGGTSGWAFLTSAGGASTSVDASGNWSLTGRINSATLQPGFEATRNTNITGIFGSGTIVFQSEVYDDASSYDPATGVFTATVPGRYLFTVNVSATETGGTAAQSTNIHLLTTNRAYFFEGTYTANQTTSMGGSVVTNMAAGDTARVRIAGFAAGGTVNGEFSSTEPRTFFSGRLMA